MSPKKENIVSAQVILRPASGKSVAGQEAITSDNIRDYMPSPESFQAVASEFAAAGFEVSAAGPTGFSITAPIATFEKFFGTRLQETQSRGVQSVKKDKSAGYELPLRGIPKGLSHHIEAVTFTPPPDFGPTSFY